MTHEKGRFTAALIFYARLFLRQIAPRFRKLKSGNQLSKPRLLRENLRN